jgi:pyruvate/2-oxoglutarate dehydrogenase complex dihydrolipoamide dehydrogenase (E3) component
MTSPEFDICVIGGGSGGLVVAAGAAALGAKVALVEKRALGGDCLYFGCIPSKALLRSAKAAQLVRGAGHYGVEAPAPGIDLAAVMARVAKVVEAIAPHDSPERFRAMGVEVIFGDGSFADTRTFLVNGRAITARKFAIATGSRPAIPALEGLATVPHLTNETVFSLTEPVPSLAVLGGGPIGVELAQAFARLGTRVHLINRGSQLLPKEDADLAQVVGQTLVDEGVELHLGCTPTRVEGGPGAIRLWMKEQDGEERAVETTHLLLAAGRRPNVEGLGLEAAGVAVEDGHIAVDPRLRTTNRDIYACGDVAGGLQFTHMAEHQAGVVLRNALFHLPAKVERRVVPWCTFTDPELARVGLSENEAKAAGVAHRVYTFPFRDVDRAQVDGETTGFAKILTDPKGRLLGAAIVGPHAGELIHEYALALARKMKASDLSGLIHVYPTLAQINRRVADARLKESLTPARRKLIQRLFGLRGE